jgi:opacity protein-like surface antigen
MVQINWKIKTYLIIIFLLFGIQKNTAQILIGPTFGLNWGAFSIANLNGSVSAKSMLGISFGAIAEIPLIPFLSIRIEPSYIQKGSDVYYPDMGGSSIIKLRNQYFQIPVELKANLPLPVISPHIFLGPDIGYLLSAKQGSNHSSIEIDVKDSYKKFDCALDFGAGLEYSIAPLIKANLDYKYSLGLLNIDNTNFTPTHTRGNQIFASILFSI